MNLSADFVKSHLAQFGLCGSNNIVPVAASLSAGGSPASTATLDGHFVWGFGGQSFNGRAAGVQKYWADYGRPRRVHRGFREELIRAVCEIHDLFGTISVTADGGYITESTIAACKAASLPFEQVVVEVEGFKLPAHDTSVTTRHVRVSQSEFRDFAGRFGQEYGCNDAWLALEVLHGLSSSLPHIYDGNEIRLVNGAYDERRNRLASRACWFLVDAEQYTAIDRLLKHDGRRGVPSILRWSPELMAAQLDSPSWRTWLRASSRPMAAPGRETWLNRAVRLELARQSFPEVPMVASMGARRNDLRFGEFMLAVSTAMTRFDRPAGSPHHYPLDRLAEHLGISFDFNIGQYQEQYGHVLTA